MENTRKPPYLHVKHKNTRKTGYNNGRKYTFFSDRQNIENTDFNPLYRQILVRVKGDQIYYMCCSTVQYQQL